MAERNSFDVFLSHNSEDKPAVETLASRLEDEAALKPFLDKWHLVPGNPWQEELENALDHSRTCAVFIGPTAISPWENEEMRGALNTRVRQPAFRVVPVLLPGATMPERSRLPSFLSRLTWVDFRVPEGVHDTNAFHRLVAGISGIAPGRYAGVSPTLSDMECPYRGLEVFEEEQSRFFFGREATTQHLVESLRGTRFLALLGASGSGKSSVVRAGLLPALRAGGLSLSDQWRYCVFKPGAHPLEELALSLARTELTDRTAYALRLAHSLKSDERTLHIEVRLQLTNQPADVRCCFIVDQFEEVFTLCQDPTEREHFVDLLRYAATVAGGQTILVLTMRTDFLSRAAEYTPLAEILSAQQFLISPMDEENLRQVIEEPARLLGLGWEEGLVETILQDIGREPGMLPLLEDALFQLWEKRGGNNVMMLSAYRAIGGVRGALAQRADKLFTTLPLDRQQVARRILLRLTQPGEGTEDTRRRTTLQELETGAEDSDAVRAVVQKLADARLLVTEEQQVDVVHEALIRGWPRLRQWIDDDRNGLRIHRRITEGVEEWGRLERDAGVLFRGALLAQAQEWREQNEAEMNALEREFLDRSVKLEVREKEEKIVRHTRAESSIWLHWTMATTLGVMGGGFLSFVVLVALDISEAVALGEGLVWVVTGAVAGPVLGIAQWFFLKKHFNQAGWWILATAGGMTGGGVLIVGVLGLETPMGVILPVAGAVLGFAQWFVLKKHFNQAGWWILVTTIGVFVSVLMSMMVSDQLVDVSGGEVGAMNLTVSLGWGCVVFGTITGRRLVLLLRQGPISKTEGGES